MGEVCACAKGLLNKSGNNTRRPARASFYFGASSSRQTTDNIGRRRERLSHNNKNAIERRAINHLVPAATFFLPTVSRRLVGASANTYPSFTRNRPPAARLPTLVMMYSAHPVAINHAFMNVPPSTHYKYAPSVNLAGGPRPACHRG